MDSATYNDYRSIFQAIKDETAADNWDMNPDKAKKHRDEVKKHMRVLYREYGPNDPHVQWFKDDMSWWLI